MPESEEDDYMSMPIPEPPSYTHETSIQRRKRKERESEAKSRTKSRAELEAEAATTRDAALDTSLPTSSKGFQLLSRLGYKPGDTLGAASNPHARLEPVGLDVKEGRGGIGMDSEKKRKVREAAAGEAKRVKVEEGEYRERVAREREERRLEGMLKGAMGIAETMDTEERMEGGRGADAETLGSSEGAKGVDQEGGVEGSKGTGETRRENVLWRTLVRERAEKDLEKRMRHELMQSLSRNANYDDPEEDAQDREAFGKEELELDDEDAELDEFNTLEVSERLERVVRYLREEYNYCFWCKYQYPDEEMEGCPGLTEEDHD